MTVWLRRSTTEIGQIYEDMVADGIEFEGFRMRIQVDVGALTGLEIDKRHGSDAPTDYGAFAAGKDPDAIGVTAHFFGVDQFQSGSVIRAQAAVGGVGNKQLSAIRHEDEILGLGQFSNGAQVVKSLRIEDFDTVVASGSDEDPMAFYIGSHVLNWSRDVRDCYLT